jgi:hypothetical protein
MRVLGDAFRAEFPGREFTMDQDHDMYRRSPYLLMEVLTREGKAVKT